MANISLPHKLIAAPGNNIRRYPHKLIAAPGNNIRRYPHELIAAPGNGLSVMDPSALAKAYGPRLIVAGRFPEGIIYKTAPTMGVVGIGVCGHCLVLVDPDALGALGVYEDPDEAKTFAGMDQVLVCAPPLDGFRAFSLADLAWRDFYLLETTIVALESLSGISGWSSALASLTINELFVRYDQEARRWWDSMKNVEVSHPKADWEIYAEGDLSDNFITNLTRGIKKYARASNNIIHRRLPEVDFDHLAGVIQIIGYAMINQDDETACRAYISLMKHPETILSITASECFSALVPGIESAAIEALTRIYHEEMVEVATHNGKASKPDDGKASKPDDGKASKPDDGKASKPDDAEVSLDSEFVFNPADRDALHQDNQRPTISLDSKFVFSLRAAYNFAAWALGLKDALHTPEAAEANLNTYLGGYLHNLDMSLSLITGSAAMSSVLCHQNYGLFASHAEFLNGYYPTTYTIMAPNDVKSLCKMGNNHTWIAGSPAPFTYVDVKTPEECPRAEEDGDEDGGGGTASPRRFKEMRWYRDGPAESKNIPYEVVPGADIDIAIMAEGDKFDQIALGHFAVIKQRFPSAILKRIDRRERKHMFRVVSEKPVGVEKGFREVDMYMSNWAEVCTNHVGMVRLAYTGAGVTEAASKFAPEFFLTASCLKSAVERGTPNYYYFASNKTTPQDIMLKYAARGYPPWCLPRPMQMAVLKYAWQTTRWNPRGEHDSSDGWPYFTNTYLSLRCEGLYNIENYMTELKAFGFEKPAPVCSYSENGVPNNGGESVCAL